MHYNTDVEIKREEDTLHKEDYRYSHPSYGMISVHRQHGGYPEPLFGSAIDSNTQIAITIKEAEVTQSLGKNWYHGRKTITEVLLTPIQYADLISNPNTQGVPCTISYTQEKGTIKYRGISATTQYIEDKITSKIKEEKEKLVNIRKEANEVLDKKGAFNKKDKEKVKDIILDLTSILTSEIPFYEEQITRSIEKQKLEAKTEVESYISSAITRTGLKAMQDPEMLKLVFKGDEGK